MSTPQISWDAPAASDAATSTQIKWDAPEPPSASSRFWAGAKAGTGGENALNTPVDPQHPISTNPMIPGAGVYRDIKTGNYAGAAGRIAGPAAELIPFLGAHEGEPAAAKPAEPAQPSAIGARVKAVGKLAAKDAFSHVPVAGRMVERPSIRDYYRAITTKPAPPEPGVLHGPPTPTPEQLNPSLVSKSRTMPGHISPEVTARPLGPEEMPPNTVPYGPHSQKFLPPGPPEPIPAEAAPAAPPRISTSPKAVGDRLNESLGGRPLQRNVPLRDQLNVKPPAAAGPKLPDGFIPTESSALRGYKYDPAKQEFEAITKDGGRYRRGEVTPEQFSKFEQADSKGKAWKELSDNSTPLGKHVDGNFTPYKRSDMRSADPNGDLTPLLNKSVAKVKAAKAKSSQ